MDEPPHKKIPRQSNPLRRCQDCNIPQSEFRILHYFLINSLVRRICTDCVLKNSLGGFCPVCFEVYKDSTALPSDHDRVTCSKCPSISHKSCISPLLDSAYLCPLCSDPNFAFFSLGHSEAGRTVDCKSSTVLRAASKCAVQSMKKAVDEARAVAEMRIKSAVIAKKEATRALDRLAFLELQEKERKESADRNSNKDDDSKANIDSNGVAESKADTDTNGDDDHDDDSKADTNRDDDEFDDDDSKADSNGDDDDSMANSGTNVDADFAEELSKLLESGSKADTNRDDDSMAISDTNVDADDSKANSDANVDVDSNADSKSSGDAAFTEELVKMLDSDSKADTNRDDDSMAISDATVDVDSNADSKSSGDAAFVEELTEMLDSDSKADTNRDDDSMAISDINIDADTKNSGDAEFAEELDKMLDPDSNHDN